MRKIFMGIVLSLTVLIMAGPVTAQEQVSQNVIKVNLFSPVVRTGSFFYERSLNEDMSFQFGFFYTGASLGDTKFRGVGVTPEFRYYLSETKPAPSGVFVAPYLRYQSFNVTADGESGKGTFSGFGGGLLVGWQTLLKNTISLEGFIGPSYTSGNLKVTNGTEEDFDIGFFDGFGIRFGFTVGFAF